MRGEIRARSLDARAGALLASTVWGRLAPRSLVEWVLEDALPVRVQVQLHKVIWGAESAGV